MSYSSGLSRLLWNWWNWSFFNKAPLNSWSKRSCLRAKKYFKGPFCTTFRKFFFKCATAIFGHDFFYVSYVKKGAKHKYTLTVEWRSVAFFPFFFFFISNLHPCYTLRSEWKVTLKAPIQIYLLIPIKKNRSFVEQY